MNATELETAMRQLGYDSGNTNSVKAFAEVMGVSWRTVYNWLRPGRVPKYHVMRIESLLDSDKTKGP